MESWIVIIASIVAPLVVFIAAYYAYRKINILIEENRALRLEILESKINSIRNKYFGPNP